jgi:hypothetical protein
MHRIISVLHTYQVKGESGVIVQTSVRATVFYAYEAGMSRTLLGIDGEAPGA